MIYQWNGGQQQQFDCLSNFNVISVDFNTKVLQVMIVLNIRFNMSLVVDIIRFSDKFTNLWNNKLGWTS